MQERYKLYLLIVRKLKQEGVGEKAREIAEEDLVDYDDGKKCKGYNGKDVGRMVI